MEESLQRSLITFSSASSNKHNMCSLLKAGFQFTAGKKTLSTARNHNHKFTYTIQKYTGRSLSRVFNIICLFLTSGKRKSHRAQKSLDNSVLYHSLLTWSDSDVEHSGMSASDLRPSGHCSSETGSSTLHEDVHERDKTFIDQ